jgi:putative colanic acid biosynthesis glycosyltransferase WcaI
MRPSSSGSSACATDRVERSPTARGLNVMILSLVFPPDRVSTAEIMADLAEDLRDRGHAVTVLTTIPHYNPDDGGAAAERQPLRPYWSWLLQRSEYHGIPVYHAAIPAKTPSVVQRILGWIGFHAVSTLAGVISVARPDVILVPSPPLSIGLSAWIIAVLRRARFVYNVQEIYPDIAVNLGALKNKSAISVLEALERFVYRKAAAVTVIAARMRDRLVAKGVPAEKVHVIPNFVDLGRLTPVPRDNEFSKRLHLENTFSVTYAGNMGPAQGLDIVIEAARLLSESDGNIRFLLIGEGMLREPLASSADTLPLKNVSVLPYQPNSMMPAIYCASDICLVPQAAATGSDAIPSKVYRIMAAARPLVAVTDPQSDLAGLVRQAQCGVVVEPGDAARLAGVVRQAIENRAEWEAMGLRGRAHVAGHYSREVVSANYDALIRAVASGTRHVDEA